MQKALPKSFAFVLMPFNDEFDDTYKLGIKAACEDSGIYCERVDEQIFEESILERIYNQINKADYIISDLSQRNVNVFYETGYAHARGKNVILLTKNAKDIPFDLKHFPHIVYRNVSELKDQLFTRLSWFEDEGKSGENIEYTEFITPKYEGLKLHDNTITIEKRSTDLTDTSYPILGDPNIQVPITIVSNTPKIISLNSYQFGLITSHKILKHIAFDNERFKSEIVKIDKHKSMNLVSTDRKLFPNGLMKIDFSLTPDRDVNANYKEEDLEDIYSESMCFTFRIYSVVGFQDFNFTIKLKLVNNVF